MYIPTPPVCSPPTRRHVPSLTPLHAELLKDMVFDGTLMDDPVVAADGHTYNRQQIERWMKLHDISPYTHLPLEHNKLVSNASIRRLINMWRDLHGHPELVIRRSADGVRASHRHRVMAQLRRSHSRHETLSQTSEISTLSKRKRAIATVCLPSLGCVTVTPSSSLRATFHLPPLKSSSSRFLTAAWNLKCGIDNGNLASAADLAWLLLRGREGLPQDEISAFMLMQAGSDQGCPHSLGILALLFAHRESPSARRLANASAGVGSKYGQFALGSILEKENKRSECHLAAAWKLQYALAAAQGLAEAQVRLAMILELEAVGSGGAADEARRLYMLAAAQGLSLSIGQLDASSGDDGEECYCKECAEATRNASHYSAALH
jgi:TPR repeat protein